MSESVSSRYELLYIIPTTFTDEEAGAVETKVNALLAKLGATVEATRRLGKLRLAYPIKNQRHGYYVLVTFAAEHPVLAKVEENLRITPEVLRHLTVRLEGEGEQKFELIPFTEVNVETKDDRPRRRTEPRTGAQEKEQKEELKSAVAAIEEGTTVTEPVADTAALSTEELDKKIESALSEDVTEA